MIYNVIISYYFASFLLLPSIRDNVIWDEEQEQLAKDKVSKNTMTFVSDEIGKELEESSSMHWNDFYNQVYEFTLS